MKPLRVGLYCKITNRVNLFLFALKCGIATIRFPHHVLAIDDEAAVNDRIRYVRECFNKISVHRCVDVVIDFPICIHQRKDRFA